METENKEERELWWLRDKQYRATKNPRLTTPSTGFLLLLLFLFSTFITCEAARPYGTNNGYDNEGGQDPICWDSRVRWENARVPPNTTQMLDDNFDTMNGKLFADDSDIDDIDVTLRTSCYQGMNLTITPNVPNVSVVYL